MSKSPTSQPIHSASNPTIPFDIADYQWEKEVERDLLLQLQSWHADARVAHVSKIFAQATLSKVQQSINDVTLTSAQLQKRIVKAFDRARKVLLATHSEGFVEPVYFPLAAGSERALGDALAKAKGLILVECKHSLDAKAWSREAYTQWTEKYPDPSKVPKTHNDGCKGRWNQLGAVLDALDGAQAAIDAVFCATSDMLPEDWNAQLIADSCHVLVASPPTEALAQQGRLSFTPYWPFVVHGPSEAAKHARPIAELKNCGASFANFSEYALALVKARNNGGDGMSTDRLEDQIIVLALRDDGDWHGYRTTDAILEAALNAALEKHQRLGKKLGG